MQIKTTNDISSLGTILGIWAHPDDEVMSMCGIMCAAIANGQSVACVVLTKGEAGVQDESRWPAKHLGAIREQELKDAYQCIRLEQYHLLDYPDGSCNEVDETLAVQRLVSLIETYQADSILTFGPDGMTGHPDHKTVSRWVSLANQRASKPAMLYHSILTEGQYEAIREVDEKFNFFFNVDRPKTCSDDACAIRFTLNDELFGCKLDCMRAMPSQYEAVLAEFGDNLQSSLDVEAFIDSETTV